MGLIDGKYEALKSLGSGMSGEVFLVRDPQGRSIALKFLKQWRPDSFKREFGILKDLNHPHIARVLDFGSFEGRYYFTSEYVEGSDFFAATQGKGTRDVEELIVQVLRALEYIHARGVFHLDIKPANLLVAKDGRIKLIDFGLAGESFGEKADKIWGTPAYMAPEILYGEIPDGRADLYSLGVLFYYALARGNPFRGSNISETLDRHKRLTPPPVSILRADVPDYLDRVLARLLEKKRGERYPSAAHVIRDINLLSGRNYPVETTETLQSYLPEEGAFIGRESELAEAQEFCRTAKSGVLKVEGGKGTGKTRFCRELKYFCQLNDLQVALQDDFENWSAADKERWFETLQGPVETKTIVLQNLSKEEVGRYVASLTGAETPETLPETLIDALYDRTDGNPLFLSEILKSLIARGLLFDAHGRWRRETLEDLGVDFSRLAIPETLKEFLRKAYAEESLGTRVLLSLLAVARRPIAVEDLAALAGTATFSDDLLALTRKGWMTVDPRSRDALLKNPLWIDVIAEDLEVAERTGFHDRLAAWLERSGRSEEAAVHWGDGSDGDKAVRELAALARGLVEKGRGAEAAPLFEKALSRLTVQGESQGESKDPRVLIDLWMELGEAYVQAHDYAASLRAFQKIRPLLTGIENRDEDILYKVGIHERLASVALKLKRTEEAKADSQAGLTLLNDYRDDPIARLTLENDLGEVWCQEGRLDQAEEIFLKTRSAWKKLSAKDRLKVTNNDLGFLYLLKGEADKAVSILQEDVEFFKTLPRRYPEARGHYNLAEVSFVLKDYARTIAHYERCAALAKEIKAYDLLLRAYNGLGNVHAYYAGTNDTKIAIDYYLRALAIAQKLEDLSSQAAIHSNLGILYRRNRSGQEAEHHLLGALRLLNALKDKSAYDVACLARAHLELGSLLRGKRDFQGARDHIRDAERLAVGQDSLKSLNFWVSYEFALLYKDTAQAKPLSDQVKKLREMAATQEEVQKIRELEEVPKENPKGETLPWKGLMKILRFLSTERDLEFLLKNILHYALDLSGAENALILEAAPDLRIRAALSAGVDPELSRFSRQVAGRVLNEGRTVATDDAQEDTRFLEARSVQLLKLRSVVALPIPSSPGAGVWGVLYLDTRLRSVSLQNPETLEILQAFADQAGLAIENARLLQEAESTKKRIQTELDLTQDQLSLTRSLLKEETREFKTRYSYQNIVTRSKSMRDLFRMLDKVTDTPLAVLIHGETGTGKELIARALHYNGSRKAKNFVAVNCGAIPSELMESELFGHKAGAFTGAVRDKVGLCEAADGGTLFLDEVGELSPALQVKFLRFLQEKEFRRVGDTEVRTVDVRVVAATHQDLEARIREGKFREDLFFRLCEVPVTVPALRERREDIPLLADHFLEECRRETKAAKKHKIDKTLLRKMIDYDWPGNVRELESFLRVACALSENFSITVETLPAHSPLAGKGKVRPGTAAASRVFIDGENSYRPSWTWADYEKRFMAQAYRHHHYKAIATAKAVGLTPPTLYRKIKEWKLEEPENPLYRDPLTYQPSVTVDQFCKNVFRAALNYHQRPYAALRALGVSQGYFYKVIKNLGSPTPL